MSDSESSKQNDRPIWERLHSTWALVEILHWDEEGESLPWSYWTERPDKFYELGKLEHSLPAAGTTAPRAHPEDLCVQWALAGEIPGAQP